jgi:tetratricopeptide (TPR) repeat protein
MRKIFALLLFIQFLVISANAQRKQIDSLKKLLQTSTTDTPKISLLIALSRKYYLQKPDSGLSYAAQALSISKRIGSKSGQAHALTQTGFSVWLLGNRPAALKTFISALNIATSLNDQWSIARNYDGMSCIYSEEGESKSAIAYAHKAEAIFDGLHDYQNVVDELMDLSDFFGSAGKPDSALFYSKKALTLSVKINEFTWRAQILMSIN